MHIIQLYLFEPFFLFLGMESMKMIPEKRYLHDTIIMHIIQLYLFEPFLFLGINENDI